MKLGYKAPQTDQFIEMANNGSDYVSILSAVYGSGDIGEAECSYNGNMEYFDYAVATSKKEHAKELAKRLKGIMCHVNLIPVNTIKEKNFKKSTKNSIILFTKTLNDSKINETEFIKGTEKI